MSRNFRKLLNFLVTPGEGKIALPQNSKQHTEKVNWPQQMCVAGTLFKEHCGVCVCVCVREQVETERPRTWLKGRFSENKETYRLQEKLNFNLSVKLAKSLSFHFLHLASL